MRHPARREGSRRLAIFQLTRPPDGPPGKTVVKLPYRDWPGALPATPVPGPSEITLMSLSSSPAPPGEPSPLAERPAALLQVFGAQPFHTDGELLALGFAADGTLWSVEDPGVLRHWDPGAGRQLGWHVLDDLATLWAFAPGCGWAASGSDELSLWDVAAGDMAAAFTPPKWVTSLAF